MYCTQYTHLPKKSKETNILHHEMKTSKWNRATNEHERAAEEWKKKKKEMRKYYEFVLLDISFMSINVTEEEKGKKNKRNC